MTYTTVIKLWRSVGSQVSVDYGTRLPGVIYSIASLMSGCYSSLVSSNRILFNLLIKYITPGHYQWLDIISKSTPTVYITTPDIVSVTPDIVSVTPTTYLMIPTTSSWKDLKALLNSNLIWRNLAL
jgi:hypothetical protein